MLASSKTFRRLDVVMKRQTGLGPFASLNAPRLDSVRKGFTFRGISVECPAYSMAARFRGYFCLV